MKPVIGQCVWNYYPWVADVICGLKRYASVVWTARSQSVQGNVAKYPLPVYASHAVDNPLLEGLVNRVTNRVFGVPHVFYRAAKHHRVALLHAHLAPQGVVFLPMARRLGLPLIVSFHGHHVYTYLNSSLALTAAAHRLFEQAALFTTVSEQMRRDVIARGCPPDKVVVHHVGVDMDQFSWYERRPGRGNTVLLTVGNFAKRKGLPDLLRALALVRDGFPEVQLRIVGGNPFQSDVEEEVRSLIKEPALCESVVLTGAKSRAEVKEEYEQADILVLPSVTTPGGEREGIPVVLMEAMATGLPVISTLHAGIPELVHDGRSGYLVPESDPPALAAAIAKLLRNPHIWRSMGQAGRTRVEKHFNLRNQIDQLQSIYNRVLSGRERPPYWSERGACPDTAVRTHDHA